MLLVFVLALLVFVIIRWQPEAWLQAQIDAQARQQGISLQYQSLQLSGFTLTLQQVHISSVRLPALPVLDSVTLKPAWLSLLQAQPSAHVLLSWHGQQAAATLIQQGQVLLLDNVSASCDATLLQPLWQQQLPLKLRGQLQLGGAFSLDIGTGQPLHGQLGLDWVQAAADMSGIASALGDYQLTLADQSGGERGSGESGQLAEPAARSTVWHWQLSGGHAVVIDGKGVLNMAAANPAAWSLQGGVTLQPGPEPSPLAAMLGTAGRKFSLSGMLTNPRLQAL